MQEHATLTRVLKTGFFLGFRRVLRGRLARAFLKGGKGSWKGS